MERSLLGSPALYQGGLRQVADGILAWLQPNGGWGESNAAVVVGEDDALLIDTLWTPALTRRMLDAVAARTGVPIRTVINTHSDGDHVWGNQLLKDAEIIATASAARIIREEKPAPMRRTRMLSPILKRLPPTSTLGSYLSRMLTPYDFSPVIVTAPQREFEGKLELRLGSRDVRLYEVGPAHTPGDLIVHVPDAETVIAGDVMFTGVHPVMWAGPTSNWVAALEQIIALEPAVVVPGHGPIAGLSEVRALRDYLCWIQSAATARLARGAGPAEVAVELAQSSEFRESPSEAWLGPERMVITVATIERHRRGAGGTVSPRERARLFAQVARVARELSA